MAIPTVLQTYPNDGDIGIPVGQSLFVIFSNGIDLDTAKKNVVLYGPDFDLTSGPDQATWIESTGESPFFLKSPNFKGVVECTYQLVYVDDDYELVDPQPTISVESDELVGPYHGKLIITPKSPLGADSSYVLYVIGDPDSLGSGIGSRTVFDTDSSVVVGDGVVEVYGGNTGGTDTVHLRITTAGDIGEAKYKWWYDTAGVGAATLGRVTSRRFRRLADGIQVRFNGSGFLVNDEWTVKVESIQRLATNLSLSFTTNDGSFSTPPASPSTPATSVPPASTLPGLTSDPDAFYVVESTPQDGDSNLSLTNRTITITFSKDIDETTVTDDSVTVALYPVSGVYGDTYQPIELNKKLTVTDNILTIEI